MARVGCEAIAVDGQRLIQQSQAEGYSLTVEGRGSHDIAVTHHAPCDSSPIEELRQPGNAIECPRVDDRGDGSRGRVSRQALEPRVGPAHRAGVSCHRLDLGRNPGLVSCQAVDLCRFIRRLHCPSPRFDSYLFAIPLRLCVFARGVSRSAPCAKYSSRKDAKKTILPFSKNPPLPATHSRLRA